MPRVSTENLNATGIRSIQKAQQDIFTIQRQISTQTKADNVKNYGRDTKTLLSANHLVARTQSFIDIGTQLDIRMKLQDDALQRTYDSLQNLRERLLEAHSLDNASFIMTVVQETFSVIKHSFNMQHNGKYIFGGTLNNRPPVVANDLVDLITNPVTDALEQGASKQYVRIDEALIIEAGPLASDIAHDVLSTLQRIAQYNAGPNGPFDQPLTPAQQNELQAIVQELVPLLDELNQVQAFNGINQNKVEAAMLRQQDQISVMESIINDVAGVDLAEMALKVNQAQTQFQVSASTFRTIRDLNLLDFL